MSQELLEFVFASGSLSKRFRIYLERAGYELTDPDSRGFCGISRGVRFWQRDRRMIPWHVVSGRFDAGLTGHDLILSSGVDLDSFRMLQELPFSRNSDGPSTWVLAAHPKDDHKRCRNDLGLIPVTVGCELPGLARCLQGAWSGPYWFEQIIPLEGNEEMAIEDGLCEAILVVSETGKSLKEAGLTIISSEPFLSSPQIIAKNSLLYWEKEVALKVLCSTLSDAVRGHAKLAKGPQGDTRGYHH